MWFLGVIIGLLTGGLFLVWGSYGLYEETVNILRGRPEPTFLLAIAMLGGGAGLVFWSIRKLRRGKSPSHRGATLDTTATTVADTSPPPREVARDAAPQPRADSGHQTSPAIFLSYRRHDSDDVTGRIYDRLVSAFDKRSVFKDVDSIPLGVDFRDYIDRMVSRCDVFIAVIGPQWFGETAPNVRRIDGDMDFVRLELESAIKRDIPIIPVLVRGARMPDEATLPVSIQRFAYRNGTHVRSDPDFHHDMDRLIEGLRGHLQAQGSNRQRP